jgi:hypothetical protein
MAARPKMEGSREENEEEEVRASLAAADYGGL